MKLDFKYKGNRNYIHGTDIYTQVLNIFEETYGDVNDIKLSFHKIAKTNLDIEIIRKGNKGFEYSECAFIMELSNNSGEYVVAGRPTSESVKGRYPYDEEKIVENCNFSKEEKSISLKNRSSHYNIELIVAMNKELLTQILPEPGKWYFGKLHLHKDINKIDSENIKVRLIRNIGSKITKSLISIDGQPIGEIYFTKVMP